MRGLRIVLPAAVLLSMTGLAVAQQILASEYVMQGKGFGERDSAYSGTCSFKLKEAFYDVSCYNKDTRHTYSGKGIRTGDHMAIMIGDLLRGDHQESYVGEYLVTYTISADGKMTGRWVHAVSGASGHETLTPQK